MNVGRTAADDTKPAVDAQHPWLGLASFTEESRDYFHGREEEVAELGRRVQRKLLTILFGQSGLGKTSILRAGIVPRLRPEGYCPVYVRVDYAPDSPSPTEQIKQAIFRATESMGAWTQSGVAVEGESLWEFLHHRDDILKDAAGKTVIPLLIFDQFEEIFTLAQADDAGRQRAAQFIEDLADLVENRPPKAVEARLEHDDTVTDRFDFGRADYRILIALREDYLAHLEGLKGTMPSITQNRMRLARMNGQQALSAVMKPGGRLVTEEVAEAIVRFIAGGSELRNAEVEPSLLSLICRELNNTRIAQGRSEISADLLAGSHDTILAEFYERALADQPAAVRKVIEDELLTESGYRESLAEERLLKAFAAAGAAPDALATLVNRRLLRIEERLDVRRVELTHDVLCGVVKASRELRLEREARDEAERQLAAQREREAATRRALVRARQVAAGAAVLAIVAVVGAIFGYVNMNRAREAELNAQSARGQAEKLIVYLLDDFYRELDPIGRLDIVSGLAQRALEYYRGLPPGLQTPDTARNQALAQVRYGVVLRRQAALEKAMKMLAESESTFRRLQEQGDKSEATALGLAEAVATQGRVASLKRDITESTRLTSAALDMLAPLATVATPSRAAQQLYAETLESRGFLLKEDEPGRAIEDLQLAREIYNRLGAQGLSDIRAAASYATSGYWLGIAYEQASRRQDARSVYEESFAMANRVLDVMPGHTSALYAKGNISSQLAGYVAEEMRMASALELALEGRRTWEGLLKTAPSNAIYRNNYGVERNTVAQMLWAMGRLDESRNERRELVEMGTKFGDSSAFYSRNMAFWAGSLAQEEAELGDFRAADTALAHMEGFFLAFDKMAPPSFEKEIGNLYREGMRVNVMMARGEDARVPDKLKAALAQLAKLSPKSKNQEELIGNVSIRVGILGAIASDRNRDFAAAEHFARLARKSRDKLPLQTKFDERDSVNINVLLAKALARQGRTAEAASLIGPVVDYHRKLQSRRHDDRMQHFEFALALHVASLAEPGRRRALQSEAAGILATLPPAMKRWKPFLQLQRELASER